MPNVTSKRSKPSTDVIDYSNEPELKPAQVARKTTTKEVPVGKIVTSTLETRIASTLAKATSMSMLNSVGENTAITPKEAYNIYYPATRMLGRRIPNVALRTNLSKPDADDLERIIITVVEYVARIIDGAFTRLYNKRVAGLNQGQHSMPQPTEKQAPRTIPVTTQEYENTVEEFIDSTSGPDLDIAPMKNGGGSIQDLVDRGFVPTDMGEMVS
jgi:hypothetical protein